MGKHTPGPWIVDAPRMVATMAAGAEGWEICDIRDDVPECDANAALIAAAPDLLEALEDIFQVVEYATDDMDGSYFLSEGQRLKVRAAIAKSKGDQQ